jgi:hypothetical protein
MKARSMLEGATYDPKTLKIISQAFDDAWESIAELYDDPAEIEHARLRLAKSVLTVAPLIGADAEAISNAAVEHFALSYRDRSNPAELVSERDFAPDADRPVPITRSR